MNLIHSIVNRITPLGVAATLLLSIAVPVLAIRYTSAAALTNRSLMVTSTVASDDFTKPDGGTYIGLPAGDPRNGAQVGHKYTFTVGTDSNIGGISFEYCTSAFGYIGGLCTAPIGFSATNWNSKSVVVTNTDTSQSVTFQTTSTSAGMLVLQDALASLEADEGDTIEIDFPVVDGYFSNPSSMGYGTYFVHIATYGTAAAALSGPSNGDIDAIDDGTVTNNITSSIGIYTRVQETLNFSVEGDQDGLGGTPDGPSSATGTGCPALTASGQMKMGDNNNALSTQVTSKAKSYFRLSTNAAYGVNVYYAGDTLRSSNHAMNTLWPRDSSSAGSEQFGIAFDLTDNVAANVGQGGDLSPYPPYENNANGYAFDATDPTTPKPLAYKLNGGVRCDTGAIEYIANIASDTPAGIYQTKINYIAAPRY